MFKPVVRFWDIDRKQMLYGCGVTPSGTPADPATGRPMVGRFVPSVRTDWLDQSSQQLWEGDVCLFDFVIDVEDGFATRVAAEGVVSWQPVEGRFMINAKESPINARNCAVDNVRKIGDVFQGKAASA